MFKKLFQRKKRLKPSPPIGLSEYVQAGLMLPGNVRVGGELLCISSEGAAVFFPAKKIPDLLLNEQVQLEFTLISEPPAHLRVDAAVAAVFEIGKRRYFQFSFSDSLKVMESFPFLFRNQFIREKSCGRLLDSNPPIKIDVNWKGGCGTAQMIHISTTGMVLGVEPELVEAMDCSDLVTLRFYLPTHDVPLKLVGRISCRIIHDDYAECGVAFEWDWGETHDFEQQESAIAVYLISLHKS